MLTLHPGWARLEEGRAGAVLEPGLGLPLPARRAVILRLMPKMLFLMPTLSILTSTAGYYHANENINDNQ